MEYESVTQRSLFGNAVLAALMTGRRFDVMARNSLCSRESYVALLQSSACRRPTYGGYISFEGPAVLCTKSSGRSERLAGSASSKAGRVFSGITTAH
jgi:hypothetical protein